MNAMMQIISGLIAKARSTNDCPLHPYCNCAKNVISGVRPHKNHVTAFGLALPLKTPQAYWVPLHKRMMTEKTTNQAGNIVGASLRAIWYTELAQSANKFSVNPLLLRLQSLTISISMNEHGVDFPGDKHMATDALTLIANPGSASRKYALYRDDDDIARLSFELKEGRIVCSGSFGEKRLPVPVDLYNLTDVAGHVMPILKEHNLLNDSETISRIGLRVVAPSSYFLEDRLFEDGTVNKLRELRARAPLHIDATLEEYEAWHALLPDAHIVGVSDSAFHATKPDYAWNYGVRLQDADRFEIKRFGYHGISVASVVETLRAADKLPPRVVVAHLGSGGSITAVRGGKSMDNTMGYSPLEGLIMSTRVGSIDPTASNVLQSNLQLSDEQMEDYLNSHSGLLGLSETSSAVNELLAQEANGHHGAHLALETYLFAIQKAIGGMAAALGGVDMLIFTGAIGERSPQTRERILERLHFLDFFLDEDANQHCVDPAKLTLISRLGHSKPIAVVPADEASEMLRCVGVLLRE